MKRKPSLDALYIALLTGAAALPACSGSPPPGGGATAPDPRGADIYDEPTSEARIGSGQGQIDEGGLIMKDQSGAEVGWAFAVATHGPHGAADGTMVEYWVKGSNWPAAPQTLSVLRDTARSHARCQGWLADICKKTGTRYYRTQVPLLQATASTLCPSGDAPPPSSAFFWSGYFTITDDEKNTVAWTLVSNQAEVWAMTRRISPPSEKTWTLTVTTPAPDFPTYRSAACSNSPALVFEPAYTDPGDICKTIPADCPP